MINNTRYAIRKTPYAKGITLIEMIVVIVVLAVAIPVLLISWADVAWRSVRSEAIAEAAFYGEELMEWVKSKEFDENDAAPWTNSASFGVETGESASNMFTYDDVDDFVGSTDTLVTTSPGGYIRSVTVGYVSLNTGVNPPRWDACGAVSCGPVTDCTTCAQCCYKLITVSVRHKNNLIGTVTMTTIVVNSE